MKHHEYLTIEETARRIRMSVRHVRRLVDSDPPELAHYRFGRALRFKTADVEAYAESRRVHPIRNEAPAAATAGAFSLTSGSLNGMYTEDRS